MWTTQRALQTSITTGLILCGLILTSFYCFLFIRDNLAPVVDLTGFKDSSGDGFLYKLERCWLTDKKIAMRGWLVHERHGTSRRSVRVIILDKSRYARAIKTTLQRRDDVNELLARKLGDGVTYRNAGFVASLNPSTTKVNFDREHLYLAYDDGETHALLPIRCPIEQPR